MPRLTPEQEAAFWRRRAEGAGSPTLGREFGISQQAALARIHRGEHPPEAKLAKPRKPKTAAREEIIDSYGEGIVHYLLAPGARDPQFEKCLLSLTPGLSRYIEIADERDRRLAALQRK